MGAGCPVLRAEIAAAGSAREPVRTATPSGKVDTQQYRDQLTAVEASLDTLAEKPDLASKLADSLPDAWTIDSAQGMVRVDATALQRGLREYSTTKSPAALKSVRKLFAAHGIGRRRIRTSDSR